MNYQSYCKIKFLDVFNYLYSVGQVFFIGFPNVYGKFSPEF